MKENIVRVHYADISDEENARRMKQIHDAAVRLIVNTEREKRRKERENHRSNHPGN